MLTVSERQMFGGALSCELPSNVHDISMIRDVPDNQEVFTHPSNDQSVMVDLLEYQHHVQGEQAARYHFEDIASSNDAMSESEVSVVERLNDVKMEPISEAWLLSGRQMVSKFDEDNRAKNLVHIYMVLYRLPKYSTDIVFLMNSPVAISCKSSSTNAEPVRGLSAWSYELFLKMASTLTLKDPSIFCE